MPLVYSFRDFTVHVYFNETVRHQLPHFHIRRGKMTFASVALLTLEPFVGPPLPRYMRESLFENVDLIWEAWNELNG
jgi:hypothetical protein